MFNCGDDSRHLQLYAVYNVERPFPCASKLPNRWGFFDFHGNLWEWCQNKHVDDYPNGRIYCGGSFNDSPRALKANFTNPYPEERRAAAHGFRVAREHHGLLSFETVRGASAEAEYVLFLENALQSDVSQSVLLEITRAELWPKLITYASLDAILRPSSRAEVFHRNEKHLRDALQPFFDSARTNEDSDTTRILTYAEARSEQIAGRHDNALIKFKVLANNEPYHPAPVRRMIECYMHLDRTEALRVSTDAVTWFPEDRDLFLLRLSLAMEHSQNQIPPDLFDRLPIELRWRPDLQNAKALLQSLNTNGAVFINSGATKDQEMNGVRWLRDMFYTHGGRIGPLPVTVTAGESEPADKLQLRESSSDENNEQQDERLTAKEILNACQTIRSFDAKSGGGYRIPLPIGRYQVTLVFAEGWFKSRDDRVCDIVIEDQISLKALDPATAGFAVAHQKSFNVELSDGVLDLELLPVSDLPTINGISIARLAQFN